MTLHQFRNEIRLKHRPIAFFLTYSGVRHASLFGQELPSFSMVGFPASGHTRTVAGGL